MSTPFSSMMQALGQAVELVSNPYFRVPEAQSEQLADAVERIHGALWQLNTVLNLEIEENYRVTEVIQFYRVMKEFEENCSEVVAYILDSPDMFPDSFTAARAEVLAHALQTITDDSIYLCNNA